MSLVIALGLMAAAVAVALAWPFLRRRRVPVPRAAYERAVFRDQLAEIARDEGRGLIAPEEAAAARAEIERRALSALSGAAPEKPAGPAISPARGIAAAAIIALPVIAGALYLALGRPDLPGRPFTERPPAPETPEAPAEPDPAALAAMAEMIAARLKETPGDARGWLLLIRLDKRLGTDRAEPAFRTALEAAGTPEEVAAAALAYGEAVVEAESGLVTPRAHAAFETALKADPESPGARFYLGLARAQAGDAAGALGIWVKLRAESPADAPWREMLEDSIRRLAEQSGLDPETPRP